MYGSVIICATAVLIAGPVWSQTRTYPPQQQLPLGYLYSAPTPRDAYRDGYINRWELERLEGPTPQALQGPSVDGKGSEGGGGDFQ